MNIRLIANLTMASLLLIGSACSGMFARDDEAAADATRGSVVAVREGVVGDQVRVGKE